MKSQKNVAGAIKACLDQLAEEAKQAELSELCQLIRVSALAAEDVMGPQAKRAASKIPGKIPGKIHRRTRRGGSGADKAAVSA